MNKQRRILLVVTLALIATTGAGLQYLKTHQRLGTPGIKATPIPGTVVMRIDLPENVLDIPSEKLEQDGIVTNTLPKDTSFASRRYRQTTNEYGIVANIVMMGKDRTSIHKPEYCLPGQGWGIESKTNLNLATAGTSPYKLSVAKWVLSNSFKDPNGRPQEIRGLYVFWFVADKEQTADHWTRIGLQTWDLLRHGVLQRWAYVSYFTICYPGQEEATFEQVQKLIAASVPEFQLPPPAEATAVIRQ